MRLTIYLLAMAAMFYGVGTIMESLPMTADGDRLSIVLAGLSMSLAFVSSMWIKQQ